ncbi:MAG TPA: type II toxin-antitoxin system MqsA family antitoxin [Thermoanaerobaculia bacterium]|nr:type II toxin-antitoxin system MqsA family antitoxin [Thermoanaerobaculia bacterium]
MVGRFEEAEVRILKCHVCGSEMTRVQTDLPFKVSETTIVIVKALPVLQCEGCGEYLLEDPVLQRVDAILEGADGRAELEILRYAA